MDDIMADWEEGHRANMMDLVEHQNLIASLESNIDSVHKRPISFITKPEEDIATNEFLTSICVGVRGRVISEIIHTKVKSNFSYKEETDSPDVGEVVSILATKQEQIGNPETIKCVVVGIVLADHPSKYLTEKLKIKTPLNAVLPIDPRRKILRVVVPLANNIKTSSIKYYVCCRPESGIYDLRVIKRECVFFFAEIASRVQVDEPVKVRRAQIGDICKRLALSQEETIVERPVAAKKRSSKTSGQSKKRVKRARQDLESDTSDTESSVETPRDRKWLGLFKAPDVKPFPDDFLTKVHGVLVDNRRLNKLSPRNIAQFLDRLYSKCGGEDFDSRHDREFGQHTMDTLDECLTAGKAIQDSPRSPPNTLSVVDQAIQVFTTQRNEINDLRIRFIAHFNGPITNDTAQYDFDKLTETVLGLHTDLYRTLELMGDAALKARGFRG